MWFLIFLYSSRLCQSRSSRTSRAFRNHPRGPATKELINSVTSPTMIGKSSPPSANSAFSTECGLVGLRRFLEVFLAPPVYNLSWMSAAPHLHCKCWEWSTGFPSWAPWWFARIIQGSLKVLFYALIELIQHPSWSFNDCPSHTPQLPLNSHRLTKPNRTPSCAWWLPSSLVTTIWLKD